MKADRRTRSIDEWAKGMFRANVEVIKLQPSMWGCIVHNNKAWAMYVAQGLEGDCVTFHRVVGAGFSASFTCSASIKPWIKD